MRFHAGILVLRQRIKRDCTCLLIVIVALAAAGGLVCPGGVSISIR